ncbi:MAG: tRNA pseudouridine(55) synthase TruB [Oscillospiraceae bacterium]|jgi:tRNA pseudouridine55 synthase|nr:tRNA pseudouridine(55) synthase TruB [Oscillospiraceae bacterium]
MANGILIVNKPADWTSQDVVSKLRGVFHERRVGHGGTLDPMATGVLPLFFGRATRGVEFFEHADKVYEAVLRLGVVTDTEDITGKVLQQNTVSVSPADVSRLLPRFMGKQQQIPPMYSAIKIGGKKLYELARAGKQVERKPREITVFALDLLGSDGADYTLRIHCSKGTYVRTLCHDIGAALGCGGCMAALTRVKCGAYTLAQALTVEELLRLAADNALPALLPVDTLFAQHPALTLTPAQESRCRNGGAFSIACKAGVWRLYAQDGEFLALAAQTDGKMQTIKSFFTPNG